MMTSKSTAAQSAKPVQPTEADFGSLIPVTMGRIGGVDGLVVNARQLHLSLGASRQFSKWFKERVEEYEFETGRDFQEVETEVATDLGVKPRMANQDRSETEKHGGDRRLTNYTLTLRTAKELAMVERGPRGKMIRRYFIDCERQVLEQQRVLEKSTVEHSSNGTVQIRDVCLYLVATIKVRLQSDLAGHREFTRTMNILGREKEDVAMEMAEAVREKTYERLLEEFLLEKDRDQDSNDATKYLKVLKSHAVGLANIWDGSEV